MSPIRPENRHRYGTPAEWAAIRAAILERAGVFQFTGYAPRCECVGECGRGTHEGRCPNMDGGPAYGTGSTVVLTIAHLNHTPEDNRSENLRAMCQGCHLHYDREHHARTRAETARAAREAAGQTTIEGT
jgi:5-methylcytosine-specific restriction endonuclease McrA